MYVYMYMFVTHDHLMPLARVTQKLRRQPEAKTGSSECPCASSNELNQTVQLANLLTNLIK
jgi:hypothetical protein